MYVYIYMHLYLDLPQAVISAQAETKAIWKT